uniref:lysozyme n=1 Tax=Pseudonaja textilis TaxID=8673 RepID=A0A670ZF11_PSETE
MKGLWFAFLCLFAQASEAKIYSKCEMYKELKKHGMEDYNKVGLGHWICLVFHSSGFDTSALNVGPRATNHGIFLLSAKWWCDDFKTPHARNYCNPCLLSKSLARFINNGLENWIAKPVAGWSRATSYIKQLG